MPTYTYECESCSNSFEKLIKIDDRDMPLEIPCEICKGKIYRPIESTAGIVSGISGLTHNTSSDFKEITRRIKKANIRSTLPDY